MGKEEAVMGVLNGLVEQMREIASRARLDLELYTRESMDDYLDSKAEFHLLLGKWHHIRAENLFIFGVSTPKWEIPPDFPYV